MRTFRFNKIIRDQILENMLSEGCDVDFQKLAGKERQSKLIDKLIEEIEELQGADSNEERLEELNDVRLVFEALIASLSPVEQQELERIHQEKLDKKGGFDEAIWVDTVSVPNDSPWIGYFESKPEKYPETSS